MKELVIGMVFDPTRENLLMLKRKKDPYFGKVNGIGGKVESGESHEEAMIRELKEETNYDLDKVDTLEEIMRLDFDKEQIRLIVYYIKLKQQYPIEIKEDHEGYYDWYNINDSNLLDAANDKIAGEGSVAYFIKFILDLK
ncbi:NUDIX domain-containing protein [Mycoplasmatota bacterium WC44]